MAYLGLGLINKNLIPIFLGCVFCFLNRILNQYEDTMLFQNPIISNIFVSFSYILTLIPYIIFIIRTKSAINNDTNVENKRTDSKYEFIYTQIDYKILKGKGRYILFSSLVFYISSIIFIYSL